MRRQQWASLPASSEERSRGAGTSWGPDQLAWAGRRAATAQRPTLLEISFTSSYALFYFSLKVCKRKFITKEISRINETGGGGEGALNEKESVRLYSVRIRAWYRLWLYLVMHLFIELYLGQWKFSIDMKGNFSFL